MIPLPQPTKVVESKQNLGVFVIEGLYPGYGITIGNSLRRVLLSSLEGAAITQVKIKGVDHEFSTLPGVLEDVIMILLNLKQMRFRMYGEEPQTASLKVKGEREVKASDFKLPPSLELANGDLTIAHTTDKSIELEMEIQVERGIGYVPALDAIFTPMKRVSSKVENMRVGDRTDFNRLTLEIETDGTITPEEAFYQATDVLLKQFEVVMSGVKEIAEARLDSSRQAKMAPVSEEEKDEGEKSPKKSGKKAKTPRQTKGKKAAKSKE